MFCVCMCASESVMCILNIYRGKMLAQGEQKSEWMNEWATAWITKKSKFREKRKNEREKTKRESKNRSEKVLRENERIHMCERVAHCSVAGDIVGRNNVHRQEWRAKWRYKEAEAEDMAISDTIHRFSSSSWSSTQTEDQANDSNKSVAKMESQSCVMCMRIGYVSCTCEKQLRG